MTLARATFTLAAGSAVSLLAGAVSAKVIALVAGPEGVGTVGLLVSLVSLAAILGGFGVGTALIRAVAMAAAQDDPGAVRRLHAAARMTTLATSALVTLLIALAREPIAALTLGDAARAAEILTVAPAVLFSAMAGVEAGLVNGLHRVGRLALVTAASALGTAIALVAAVVTYGASGAATGLLVGSMIGWVVALIAATRTRPSTSAGDRRGLRYEAVELLRFGGPYTASQLLGTGAQLLVPFVVLSVLQPADVGYYRAAATISVAYLAFLLNAMAQDYYPRISAAPAETLAAVARRQLRFVLSISLPLVLLTSAVAPLIVVVLYSPEFQPATDVLRWHLVGDVLKLPSWVLSFVVLARASSTSFLGLEAIGGLALIAFSALAIAAVGVVGAGIGYAAAYAVYYLAAGWMTRRIVPVTFGTEERMIVGAGLLLIAAQLLRPTLGDLTVSLVVGLLGTVWAVVTARRLLAGRDV